MTLTNEEERELREQTRRELQEVERRMLETQERMLGDRQKIEDRRIRQQIIEEEKARYFVDKGYVQYTDRQGNVDWVTPEELRRRRRSAIRRRRALVLRWALNGSAVAAALLVFLYLLLKFNAAA